MEEKIVLVLCNRSWLMIFRFFTFFFQSAYSLVVDLVSQCDSRTLSPEEAAHLRLSEAGGNLEFVG